MVLVLKTCHSSLLWEVKAEDSEFKAGLGNSLLHSFIVVLVMEVRSLNMLYPSSQCGPFRETLVGGSKRQQSGLVGRFSE